VPENQKLIVRSAVVPFSGNPRNEMTGDGPIEVYVKQKLIKGSAIEKAAHTFSKYANRKFSVNVCADGQACVLAQESLAPQAKIGRAIQSVLPARQLVNDVVRSGKGSELTAWLIGGGGMSQVHAAATGEHTALVMAAGGMIVKAASTIASAAKAQAAVRQQAFKSTLTWIDETKAAEGAYPYLGQAYKRYKDTLENLSPGALPLDMTQFAQQLSINNR
jgi:hypothetical protein